MSCWSVRVDLGSIWGELAWNESLLSCELTLLTVLMWPTEWALLITTLPYHGYFGWNLGIRHHQGPPYFGRFSCICTVCGLAGNLIEERNKLRVGRLEKIPHVQPERRLISWQVCANSSPYPFQHSLSPSSLTRLCSRPFPE